MSHRPALTAVVAWRHVLSSSFKPSCEVWFCVDRWMSLRSGTDLSVLSVEAVHLHVRQGRQVAQPIKTMKKLVLAERENRPAKNKERGGLK